MLSTQVNKYICFGELANIVFNKATDGSYPKTWFFPPNTATLTRQMYIFSAKGTSKLACCLMVCDTS